MFTIVYLKMEFMKKTLLYEYNNCVYKRWPRKSEYAKECATTHLSKELHIALKMDGAKAS